MNLLYTFCRACKTGDCSGEDDYDNHHPERECWRCSHVYDDNADADEEAHCPKCDASQAECDICGDPGAEQCTSGCESHMCPGCWPGHPNAEETGKCPGGGPAPPPITAWNLADAEKGIVVDALRRCGSLVHAAIKLGITRHSLKRRIIKYGIKWARPQVAP